MLETMPSISKVQFGDPEMLEKLNMDTKGLATIRYGTNSKYPDMPKANLSGFNLRSLWVETGEHGQITATDCSFDSLLLRCYGRTKADFRTCPAKNVDVETSSNAEVHALVGGGTLNASVNGGSTFYYYGNAEKETIKIAHPAKVINKK